ncbi:metallophosphoesterase [Allorhodopirellula heiligendammensis]|uniref:Phosphodiesterase YaeI n=1 Tax=Allorhodopirellula heiligendammensis TaxID=2714739 RepID=A0A5C6BX06_9BACT|nr:metallophosphoesterase [Allorhodopirellula heiligendammensis]TWU16041.1 phosphodiesterase YaeI [Allorhodopirellula heiligendammensis]
MNLVWVCLALIAHFGLRLSAYNRLNSLGWPRRAIKRIEKLMFLETWVTPAVIGIVWARSFRSMAEGSFVWDDLPLAVLAYGVLCLILGGMLFVLWLLWRPIFGVQHAMVTRVNRVERASREDIEQFARTPKCRRAARIPGNQFLDLAIENIDIPLARLPRELDGYRIAHLSDIHLTGDLDPAYMARVINRALEFRPEMFALTGDIVDAQECVAWLAEMFSAARANDGSFFILGNHDTRVAEPSEVRRQMAAGGWTDVGGCCRRTRLRGIDVTLCGNEWPWFERPSPTEIIAIEEAMDAQLKICLSHSPDQYDWARRHQFDLLLCGHTHGGQGRLPLAGPILSPSWHGTRWASGDFYRAPTTMHVSRGLGGVHLLRIHCRPELSLLTLRAT